MLPTVNRLAQDVLGPAAFAPWHRFTVSKIRFFALPRQHLTFMAIGGSPAACPPCAVIKTRRFAAEASLSRNFLLFLFFHVSYKKIVAKSRKIFCCMQKQHLAIFSKIPYVGYHQALPTTHLLPKKHKKTLVPKASDAKQSVPKNPHRTFLHGEISKVPMILSILFLLPFQPRRRPASENFSCFSEVICKTPLQNRLPVFCRDVSQEARQASQRVFCKPRKIFDKEAAAGHCKWPAAASPFPRFSQGPMPYGLPFTALSRQFQKLPPAS